MEKNKFLIVLVIILSVLVVGLGGYLIYDKLIVKTGNESQETKNDDSKTNDNDVIKEEIDTFSLTTESGKVRVKGYAIVDKLEDELGNYYDYVFFHILETKNSDFINYIKNHQGNYFFRDNSIGLGCYKNNIINYYNNSDQNGLKNFSFSIEDTNRILNSSNNNPILLDLEILSLTNPAHAALCYSHITNINIIN